MMSNVSFKGGLAKKKSTSKQTKSRFERKCSNYHTELYLKATGILKHKEYYNRSKETVKKLGASLE